MKHLIRWLIEAVLLIASFVPVAAVWICLDVYGERWIDQRPAAAQFDWFLAMWGAFFVGIVLYLRYVRMHVDPWINERLPILRRNEPEDRDAV